ncbi:MAG TPA: grasp-with-spasm system SPASM domain peptide maturase, partial [Bacteroidia bacterium]|nr:grasp-with-spasm system SPASM domain peptide maturase [Bacteroidia bacterium]
MPVSFDNDPVLCLVANCIPVKGARRSLIADLDRNEYRLIPNSLCDLLQQCNKREFSYIKAIFPASEQEVLLEYLDFLQTHDYIFWVSGQEEALLFPDMPTIWDYPSVISNAIIDIGRYSKHPYPSIFNQLGELGCKDLQIRSFCPLSPNALEEILVPLQTSAFKSIDLVIPFAAEEGREAYLNLARQIKRIRCVFIYGAPEEETVYASDDQTRGMLFFTTQQVVGVHDCGIVDPRYFTVNPQLYTESLRFNSCLNRKISIDQHGDIRNCPSMESAYGNVSTLPLARALELPGFKANWTIHKDKIRICKDCEFRYVCVDCRAYLENPLDIYSKPLKCGYDPYTAEWEEWST